MTGSLPPFNINMRIADQNGKMSPEFLRMLNQFKSAIENEFGALEAADAALAAAATANAAAETAQTAADAANTAAGVAQSAADQVASDSSLASSGTVGLTLTASDAGASATIAISAHERVYGDGTSVSVNSGSVTGLAYSTTYFIYYDDPTRSGGAVTYHASTNAADAVQSGDVHSVGAVATPAAAGIPNDGQPWYAPGIPYY